MKPEAQRIAIAEACGWPNHKLGLGWFCLPDDIAERAKVEGVIDYTGNLNAMHEAEKVLSRDDHRRFRLMLIATVCAAPEEDDARSIVSATAAQRAEAFLKTLGKWTDSQ